ncbi:hypothetical protein CAPTEDRAFT_209629 [Capitella teleta]|uniref:Uncharacterized protein n=1 Tax=Capitella teleta TaxID=283909 RepID=R7V6K3_CAPTE|nr:hypothetical protein CAPTEDRAFT_209629 [Capitella teleta]|eukprot:ELU14092.1 hypothetical protein CAPTEDRAFT_209629 [Capitella teleta]
MRYIVIEHYRQSLNKHAAKVAVAKRAEFKGLGEAMLTALTINAYLDSYQLMLAFVRNEEQSLRHWLDWWNKRRRHVMNAFKPVDSPAANKAEIGHAKLANTSNDNMFLVEACRIDIAEAIRTEEYVKAKATGAAPLGRGQMPCERQKRLYDQQMRIAVQCGKELGAIPSKQMRTSPVGVKSLIDLPPLTPSQQLLLETEPFVLCFRFGVIRKCFGCEEELTARNGGLIVRKRDYRTFPRNGRYFRKDTLENTYYDLNMRCMRKKYPRTDVKDIVVHPDLDLNEEHMRELCAFGLHARCHHG